MQPLTLALAVLGPAAAGWYNLIVTAHRIGDDRTGYELAVAEMEARHDR
jgi:hypothetical protein